MYKKRRAVPFDSVIWKSVRDISDISFSVESLYFKEYYSEFPFHKKRSLKLFDIGECHYSDGYCVDDN